MVTAGFDGWDPPIATTYGHTPLAEHWNEAQSRATVFLTPADLP
jgi:hypothetical protein